MKNSFVRVAIIIGIILLVPLVAMQFTNEVDWHPADSLFMGTLLFVTGMVVEFVLEKLTSPIKKAPSAR